MTRTPPTTGEGARRRRSLRRLVYGQLNPKARRRGLSVSNGVILAIIILSVTCTILQTEPTIAAGRERLFDTLEAIFAWTFAAEYALRLWIAVEEASYRGAFLGRLRWALTPMALIDLIAWAPSLILPGLVPTYVLRIFRLARILRLAKLGRMSRAWSLIVEAVAARRFELMIVTCAGGFVMLLSATALYMVEGQIQPEHFGSIPRALWWSAMTLTTIGYGDVYPLTVLGKVLAVLTAVTGIGLIAAPTGVLAGAFSEAFQRHRQELEKQDEP
ncbi:MAG: ion transporter [Caulobacterales bacterium]